MKNNSFNLLWKYIKPFKSKVFFYIVINIVTYLGYVITPIIFGYSIEYLTDGLFETFLYLLFLYFSVRIFISIVLNLSSSFIYNFLEKEFIHNVTADMYKKINDLPAIAFEEKGTGELTNRLISDPEKIITLLDRMITLGSKIFSFIFVFFIIFFMSWILAIEITLFILVMSFIVYIVFPKFEKLEKDNKENSDKLNKILTENISGIREIKALGIKSILGRKVNKQINNLTSSIKKANNYIAVYWHFNNFIYYLFELTIFLSAGYLVYKNELTLALFLSLQTYMWRVDDVVYSFGEFSKNYSKVKVAFTRIDEIINNKLYKDEMYGDKILDKNKGVIVFENVKFKYKDDEEYTLKGLNLECKANQKTAIIGKSGNGKSTIFNLLVRYFDSSEGNILIDGTNIKDLTESSLRENISIIRQNPYIFNMSIKDNLKLVKEKASDKEIIDVCKKAYIHDYINSLPKGYDTMIGEGGVNLSGGQKQRLAIARTLLIKSKIILFDEATSALDNESQKYIKQTIDELSKTHTIIIIAHRLSTIIDADVINVIEDGKVVDKGTHKELIKKSKTYKSLYNNEE